MEDPPKKFFRLAPGREVRLRYAYFITCDEVVKDDDGEWSSCAAPTTRPPAAATRPTAARSRHLHWVSAAHAVDGRGAALRPPVHEARPRAPRATSRRLNPDPRS